ncbi:MAG: DUF4397 domain-containing protein [Saprospiraceae bacterium]|nr:DUF4397 domain-containing protein [Saprospiraceae bacterium]
MIKNYLSLLVMFLLTTVGWSQTANVQIIHNSADPAAATVDIYLNQGDMPAIDDLNFREATEFLALPAGVMVDIGIAPGNSTGPADIIASFDDIVLTPDENYVVTATGVLDPTNFDDTVNPGVIGFTLAIYAPAQTEAADGSSVDLLVYHGSTDAPAVDVVVGGSPLIDDISYGTYTDGYTSVPAGKYILNVTPAADNNTILLSYLADLSGLGGGSATVFASGFLAPGANQGGAGFGLFAALANGTVVELPLVAAPTVVINEVDYDQLGPDAAEFIELANNGDTEVSLFGSSLNLINGSNNEQYDAIELPDVMVGAGEYYVICFGDNNAAYCDLNVSGSVQNGGPDAIELTFQGMQFDALSYEGSVDGFVEGSGDGLEDLAAIDNGGLARFPDGADTNDNAADFRFQCITPGASNESGDFSCITTNANVQVIHNSPTPGTMSGPTVDIYVNGLLLPELTGVPYRAATGFLPLPAGVDVEVAVAVSPSNSVADAIATFPLGQLIEDENYVVVANGIVGDMDAPFNLEVNAGAKTMADDSGTVEFAPFHGSAGAPNVDIDARAVGTLVENIAFGEFRAYQAVAPELYYLDVRAAGDPNIVATFEADLSGLAGGAATVFASGLLGNTPGFGLFAALPDGTVVEFPAASVARVQVIHNSPAPVVDVYANDELLLDDFEFRTATPFVFLPGDVNINLAVAPGGSTSSADAIYDLDVTLENGGTYVVTANGIVGNMDTPFELAVNAMARERSNDPDNVDVAVFHGSPGAPNVDVDARLIGTLFGDVEYGTYDGYQSVPADLYYLDIRPTGSMDALVTFEAALSGLAGEAITVFASGVVEGNPAFGLFAALPNGDVVELPATGAARTQIIHNSPSGTVDVYINGQLAFDDFEFLTATGFDWIRADVAYDIAIAGADSESAADAFAVYEDVIFEDRSTSVIIAAGLVADGTFDLFIEEGQEASLDNTAFEALVFHGSPDAPAIDIEDFVAGELLTDFAFGDFSDGYVPLAPIAHVFDVYLAGTEDLVAEFFFNLTGGAGLSGVVFAGGFVGGDDPALNLYVALADGTVIPFLPVTLTQFIHNSPAEGAEVIDLYANGGLFIDDFEYQTATPYNFAITRDPITVAVAPPNSTSDEEAILFADPFTLEDGKFYTVIAGGIPGDADTPFELFINDNGRLGSESAATLDLSVFHGGTDAPAVDVVARGVGTLLDGIAYGEFSDDYLSVPPANYFIEVRPDGDESVLVGTFNLDASTFGGAAATVFASGLLAGDPDFDLLAALPDGTVLRFTPVSQVQVIHNSPSPTVDVYANDNILLDDFVFRTATPYVDLPTRTPIDLAIAGENSSSSADAIANFDGIVLEDGKVYVIMATGVVGDLDTPFDLAIFDEGRTSAAAGVDLLLYHGAPDAPDVDVVAQGVGVLFDDVAYGSYDGYLNVPASDYVIDVTPADDNNTIVRRYDAPLSGFENESLTVFASGFLGTPGEDDEFQVWVAQADGTTFPLDELVAVNTLNEEVASFAIVPNPAKGQTEAQYTITETLDVTLNVYDATGRLMQSQYAGKQTAGSYYYTIDLRDMPAGMYNYSIVTPKGVMTKRFTVVK